MLPFRVGAGEEEVRFHSISERVKNCLILQKTVGPILASLVGLLPGGAALGHQDLQPHPMGITRFLPRSQSLCLRSKLNSFPDEFFICFNLALTCL